MVDNTGLLRRRLWADAAHHGVVVSRERIDDRLDLVWRDTKITEDRPAESSDQAVRLVDIRAADPMAIPL